MGFQLHVFRCVFLVFAVNIVSCIDLTTTDIKTVNDENRYLTLHPDVKLSAFSKVNHVKGNIIFRSGERIDGDRLILTYMEEAQYTRETDIEVSLWYPASGTKGKVLSFVEIYVDLSSSSADAFFVGNGGIGRTYAEILLVCNLTNNFGYQIYIYGY